jgi:aspartyl-tRNA synthetase
LLEKSLKNSNIYDNIEKQRINGGFYMYRTKTCGELKLSNIGETVELSGWIQKIRNLGGMIFIDLRDEFGITQIVVNDEELQEQAKQMNTESCIHISRTSCGKNK